MIWFFLIACMFLAVDQEHILLVLAVAAISGNDHKHFNPARSHNVSTCPLDSFHCPVSVPKDSYKLISQTSLRSKIEADERGKGHVK